MRAVRYFNIKEFALLLLYKVLFDFVFLELYLESYGYLYTNIIFRFSLDKWMISNCLFLVFCFLLFKFTEYERAIYVVIIRISYVICVIPMLSVYAFFSSIVEQAIVCPCVFWILLVILFKYYAQKTRETAVFQVHKFLKVDILLFSVCAVLSLAIWLWAGHPIIINFSEAYEQRMELRASAMPTAMNYLFFFLGGTIFPYYFAKYLDKKKYIISGISFVFGILLYCINGMKSWLLLYLLCVLIFLIIKLSSDNIYKTCLWIESGAIILLFVSCFFDTTMGFSSLVAQFGRITVIPNNIGFRYIDFFSSHELLYLRESILRLFIKSPYVNGSDFYINYGADSTLTSARSNNGLWGDAYKNFGIVGTIVYPFAIAKIFDIVERNGRKLSNGFLLFLMFMILWNSINVSFFTWLLTGGVIIVILMEKIDSDNLDYYESQEKTTIKNGE